MAGFIGIHTPKKRSYRFSNMSRDGNGGLAGDVEYADGRVRRFHVSQDETGDLVGDVEELDRVADATPAPTPEAAPEPSGMFAGVFGSPEGV
jgi:hypothetical protein